MSDRPFWAALLAGALLSLAGCCIIATQWMILGSPDAGWYYGYVRPFTVRSIGAALIVIGTASALLLLRRAASAAGEWGIVLAWVLLATWSHVLLRSVSPVTLEKVLVSDAANSFYSVTSQYDVATVLRDFGDVRAKSPIHAQSNMPGKLVFLYALRALWARAEVVALLIVLISNAGGALMYLFARELFHDQRTALYALVLYLFVPAKLYFLPLMNTVTPVFVLACACLLQRWLQTGRAIYAAALGISVYALVFFEPLPLVTGVLFAGLIARAVWRREMQGGRVLTHLAIGTGAFASTYVIVYASSGFDMIDAFRQIRSHAVEFNVASQRAYRVWIRRNILEFAVGAGLCQVAVFWAALADGLRGPGSWVERVMRPVSMLCLCLAAILIATNLIGVNRGEVIRLWIFLACFFQIPAAYVCARLPGHGAILVVLATAVLQAALGTAMMGFIITR